MKPAKSFLFTRKSLLYATAILVFLTFSLTGCGLVEFLTGQKEPAEPTTAPPPAPSPTEEETPENLPGLTASSFAINVPAVTYEQKLTIPGNVGIGSRLYIDGREIPVNPDGSFSAEVSLNPGVNTLVFKVVSGNNAVYSTGRQVTYKPQPPLTLDNIPNPYVSETPTLVVKGNTAPRSQVEVNGVKGESDSNGHFMVSVNLTEGENVLNVTAVNADGVKSTLQRTVIYNKPQQQTPSPPLLVVTSPPEDGYLSSPQLTITGVTDPNNLVEVYNNYFVADKEVKSLVFSGKVNNGNFSAKVTLSEGRNQLLIRALNAQGQSAQVTRTVTYKKEAPAQEPHEGVKDTEPPVIDFFQISPLKLSRSASSTSNTTNELTILAKVTDDHSGVARVIVEYYNPEKTKLITIELHSDSQLQAWTGTHPFGTNDQTGEYTLNSVRVYDRDGNWKTYNASELKNATTTFTLQ